MGVQARKYYNNMDDDPCPLYTTSNHFNTSIQFRAAHSDQGNGSQRPALHGVGNIHT